MEEGGGGGERFRGAPVLLRAASGCNSKALATLEERQWLPQLAHLNDQKWWNTHWPTKKAIKTVMRPPRMLKKHVATPATPRQLGPMGSVARALPASVMLPAATPEQTLRARYHQ